MNTPSPRTTKSSTAHATLVDVCADTLLSILADARRAPVARTAGPSNADPSPETASIVHVTAA